MSTKNEIKIVGNKRRRSNTTVENEIIIEADDESVVSMVTDRPRIIERNCEETKMERRSKIKLD